MIKIKRVYKAPSPDDGYRVLVDRLWPRGLTKAKVKIGLWLKEIAPSSALRKEFAHDPEKWADFQSKYGKELGQRIDLLGQIKQLEKEKKVVTLVFGAKDEQHNNAVVLQAKLAAQGKWPAVDKR